MSKQLAEIFKNLEHELVLHLKNSLQKYQENSINKIIELENKIGDQNKIIDQMKEKIDKTTSDEQNYQNFSLISNFSKQITEKELEIKKYQAQLRIASKTIKDLQCKVENVFEQPEELDSDTSRSTPSVSSVNADNTETIKNKLENVKDKLETVKNKIEKITAKKPEPEKQKEEESEQEEQEEQDEPQEEQDEPQEEQDEPQEEQDEPQEEQEEPKEESEEEIEVNFTEIKIKSVNYFISDETPPLIYEYLKGEPGDIAIGEKQGRKYVFYDKKK
jgi:chromosome segregation ATPase